MPGPPSAGFLFWRKSGTLLRMQAHASNAMQAHAFNAMQAPASNAMQAHASNPMQAPASNAMQAHASNAMQAHAYPRVANANTCPSKSLTYPATSPQSRCCTSLNTRPPDAIARENAPSASSTTTYNSARGTSDDAGSTMASPSSRRIPAAGINPSTAMGVS